MLSFIYLKEKNTAQNFFFSLLLFFIVIFLLIVYQSPISRLTYNFIAENASFISTEKQVILQTNVKDYVLPTLISTLKQGLQESCTVLSWIKSKKREFIQDFDSKVKEIISEHSNKKRSNTEKSASSTSSKSSGKSKSKKEKRNSSHKEHFMPSNIQSKVFDNNRIDLTCITSESVTKFVQENESENNRENCENEVSHVASLEPVEGMILTIDSTKHISTTSSEDRHKIIQYELIERIHHKLGLVDAHKIDFAYAPEHSFSVANKHEDRYQKRQRKRPYQPKEDFLVPLPFTNEYISSISFRWISAAAKNIWNKKDFGFSSRTSSESIPQLEMKPHTPKDIENSSIQRSKPNHDRISNANNKMMASNIIASVQQLQDAQIFVETKNKPFSPWENTISDSIDNVDSDANDRESSYTKMGERAFAGGAQGEVWRARRKCPKEDVLHKCDESQKLIMKRLKLENGNEFLEGGLREVFFGGLLAQHQNSSELFTQYIDHFFRKQALPYSSSFVNQQELWIVFEDAGPSLRSYLYTAVSSGTFFIYEHSDFWRKLRIGVHESSRKKSSSSIIALSGPSSFDQRDHHKAPQKNDNGPNPDETASTSILEGKELMKQVLKQLLTSALVLHEQGIIHRDIKPSNIMCYIYDISTLQGVQNSKEYDPVNCVLGDFSSAWEKDISRTMYMNGPSAAEQTDEYAPPEVLFGPRWIPFDENIPTSYDSWSIGVVVLEMLLGTPHVFSVDQRTTMILSHRLRKEGASSEDIRRALYLAGLSQFCIYVPSTSEEKKWPLRHGDPLHNTAIVKPTCTIQDFHNALRARDPLGLGFDSSSDALLDLIWGLLAWDPSKRLTAAQALNHHYFHPTKTSDRIQNSHALNPQLLDPNISAKVDKHQATEFECPKCGKTFHDWNSCHIHARRRKHALFCDFDRSNLPPCLNAHSMLPAHPTSGYCDIQGRRPTIEDFHAIHLHQNHQFYGVFDGHWGNLASKYSARYMYASMKTIWSDLDERVLNYSNWKETVAKDLEDSFFLLHKGFLSVVKKSPGKVMNKSGSTATILLTTNEAVIVANVGDSRAILSHGTSYNQSVQTLSAIQLTVDHIASDKDEKSLIERKGGYISSSGSIKRVNGTLAVTRSIGDVPMMKILSQSPHVWIKSKKDVQSICKGQGAERDKNPSIGNREEERLDATEMPCFVVIASDGLWDVMSNQEVVEMVVEVLRQYHFDDSEISWEGGGAFQVAAQKLTQEAYVRGSTDNIGVCVVAIT